MKTHPLPLLLVCLAVLLAALWPGRIGAEPASPVEAVSVVRQERQLYITFTLARTAAVFPYYLIADGPDQNTDPDRVYICGVGGQAGTHLACYSSASDDRPTEVYFAEEQPDRIARGAFGPYTITPVLLFLPAIQG